jgi:hypothetical protein
MSPRTASTSQTRRSSRTREATPYASAGRLAFRLSAMGFIPVGLNASVSCAAYLYHAPFHNNNAYTGDRPRIPPAQESGVASVVRPVLWTGACLLSRGHRRPLHRGPAARRRPGRSRARTARRGTHPRAVCQRSALRGLVVHERRHRAGPAHRHGRPQQRASGAGRDGATIRRHPASHPLWRRRGLHQPPVRAARIPGRDAVLPSRQRLSRLGREPLLHRASHGNHSPSGSAHPPLRPHSGARRRQALLHRQRGSR